KLHSKTQTPAIAIAGVVVLVIAFALFLPLVSLASATSFALLLVFILVNSALIVIKKRQPAAPGVRVYPFWVPIFGVLSCLALLLGQLTSLLS
ncbi:MAG: APA family basic amino acid/polyamine antiporter, partial [Gammaproteobacteria bacterium]